MPRVSLPDVGVTFIREACTVSPRTLLLVLRSYRLIRKSLLALLCFGYSPRLRSPCRLLPAPAASGTFPTLFCESFLRCLSPCPGGPLSAFAWFFLRDSSAFPHKGRVGFPRFCPRTRFSTACVSRLQLFRYVQASQLARLPDRSYRCKFLQGSQGFYLRAERVSLPSHASDTLSARLQAIGGTRTCTSLDSQHCRLLTFAPQALPRFIALTKQCAPGQCIGTFGLVGSPLVPFPSALPTRFSSSVRKPR